MKKNNNDYINFCKTGIETPLIKLNNFFKDKFISTQIWAKCEFMNPSGSINDRYYSYILSKAENESKLKIGDTIYGNLSTIEALSLAQIVASRGYKLIISLIDTPNNDVKNIIKTLGTKLVIENINFESYMITIRSELIEEEKIFFNFNKYKNEVNLELQDALIADEIIKQKENNIDTIILPFCKNDIFLGISKQLKKKNPFFNIIGVEFSNKLCKNSKDKNEYMFDSIISIEDIEVYSTINDIVKKEGLLIGRFSALGILGLNHYIKNNITENINLNCIIIFPDSIKTLCSYLITEEWMIYKNILPICKFTKIDNDFFDNKRIKYYIKYFKLVPNIDSRITISDCLDLFKKNFEILPLKKYGKILGIVTQENLLKTMLKLNSNLLCSCHHFLEKRFITINLETPMWVLYNFLEQNIHVIIENKTEFSTENYCTSIKDILKISENNLKELI